MSATSVVVLDLRIRAWQPSAIPLALSETVYFKIVTCSRKPSQPHLPPLDPSIPHNQLELTFPLLCPSIGFLLYFSSTDHNKLPRILEVPVWWTFMAATSYVSPWICKPSTFISRTDFSLLCHNSIHFIKFRSNVLSGDPFLLAPFRESKLPPQFQTLKHPSIEAPNTIIISTF